MSEELITNHEEALQYAHLHKHESNLARAYIALSQQTEPVAVYGKCPVCGCAGKTRERRPNGNDTCINGHTYPSAEAITRAADQVNTDTVSVPIYQLELWRVYLSQSDTTLPRREIESMLRAAQEGKK